jgi:hypothetical protein
MTRLALALLVCSLAGCSSLWYAGVADYRIEPLTDSQGKPTGCCALEIHDGKQYQTVNATFSRTADGNYAITLNQQDVQAFKGQAIAASAASDVTAAATSAAIAALKTIK